MYITYIEPWKKYISDKKKIFKNYYLKSCNHLIDEIGNSIIENKKIPTAPFIKKTKKRKKWARKLVNRKKVIYSNETKTRDIFISLGKTSILYSFFGFYLQNCYENFLNQNHLNKNIIAYRTIEENGAKKCNIHFAKDVFDFVGENEGLTCFVVDIENFFDNLDHKMLIANIKKVLNCEKFDNYLNYVLKNITNYKYVEEELYPTSNKMRRSFYSFVIPRSTKRTRKLARKAYKQKIFKNTDEKGIPQGTSLSGTLSNIYMIEFDTFFANYAERFGGIYRRYSDDIILILPTTVINQNNIHDLFAEQLKNLKLEINEGKYREVRTDDKNHNLIYLGLVKTKNSVWIKPNSISKYYKSKSLLAKKIYKKLSARNRQTVVSSGSKFRWLMKSNHKNNRGDFIGYVKKAERIFGSDSKITNQLRKRAKVLKRIIENRWNRVEDE